jgi:bacillithiol biosynthesis deacetylase BshB1
MTATAMVIGPHPDDAELAMGAAIARMVGLGMRVVVIDLTNGEPTPHGSEQIRREETARATAILGISHRVCLDMPNRTLQPTLEHRRKLAEAIRLHRPDVLFGPTMPDLHPDHVAAVELLAAARFDARLHKTDMAGQPWWTPRQYGYYSTHRGCIERPAFILDATDHWARKMQAIKAYQSQISHISPANPISLAERVEQIGRYFGQAIGVRYAEPFSSPEPLALTDIAPLLAP